MIIYNFIPCPQVQMEYSLATIHCSWWILKSELNIHHKQELFQVVYMAYFIWFSLPHEVDTIIFPIW